MDRIDKALNKLRPKEKKEIKNILSKVKKEELQGLDLKKLKARDDIYRVRKGGIRIIFYKKKGSIRILGVERKRSKTYKRSK